MNIQKLTDLILNVSSLSMKEDVQELDFNPVIADHKKAVVVDARLLR